MACVTARQASGHVALHGATAVRAEVAFVRELASGAKTPAVFHGFLTV